MKYLFVLASILLSGIRSEAQSADELVSKVKSKLERVNNYEADAKLKTNVSFIKAPIANVKIYYIRPDKLKIINKNGISFIPRGTVNINLGSVIMNNKNFDIIDAGKDSQGLRIIKLLPKDDTADVVLSTYELEMNYGKYSEYGLPDRIVFSFNTKEYKLPKGVTLDYDNGSKKNEERLKNKKGTIEISYTSYIINKGAATTTKN